MQITLVLVVSALAGCMNSPVGGGGGSGSGVGGGGGGGSSTPSTDCPGSPLCSTNTPVGGLLFHGAEPRSDAFPNGMFDLPHHHILAGGNDEIRIQTVGATSSTYADFALPFTTATTGTLAVDAVTGPVVTLHQDAGLGMLEIIDPSQDKLFDTYHYAASALATVTPIGDDAVTSVDWAGTSASSFVFWVGDVTASFAVLNAATPRNRLIDTSLTLELAGATQTAWDTLVIPNAAAGDHDVTVTAGDGSTHVARVTVVDHVDSIKPLEIAGGLVCFGAYAQDVFIANAPWVFSIGGTVVAGLGPHANCMFATIGSVVTATVGGKSLTVTTVQSSGSPDHDARDAQIATYRAQVAARPAALQ